MRYQASQIHELTVGEVMNPSVIYVDESMSVRDLVALLKDHEITGAPVRDKKGKVVGVISLKDSVEAASDQTTVAELMTPTVYAIPRQTLVTRAAKTMIAGRIHRLLVADKGKYVGLVTTLDLLKVIADLTDEEPAQDVCPELTF